jgi:hypothetical protein
LKKKIRANRDFTHPVLPPAKAPIKLKDESSGKEKKQVIDLTELEDD